MKIKKEKYESLRLELQEFTPQEFVATCYKFDCIGDQHGQYFFVGTATSNSSNIHDDDGHPDIQRRTNNVPSQTYGYVVDKIKGNGSPHQNSTKYQGYMFSSDGLNHFSMAGWVHDPNNLS